MRTVIFACFLALVSTASASAQLKGDPKRGGQVYRACVACHSLREGVHLTGPSLAGIWGEKTGHSHNKGGFQRHSSALKASNLMWDASTLDKWLADPAGLVPGNYMTFRGIKDSKARADLIAFLQLATVHGGAAAVVKQGLLSDSFADGQIPDPLRKAGPEQQVAAIRKCADTYFVKTADGREQPHWEMNVRLKTDTSQSGPQDGRPVLTYAGMQGDRVSIIFSNTGQIARFIKEKC